MKLVITFIIIVAVISGVICLNYFNFINPNETQVLYVITFLGGGLYLAMVLREIEKKQERTSK